MEFFTPPDHVKFSVKKLFANMGEVIDGSIAYLDAMGGGPLERHTHTHNHLFIVVKGRVKILLGDSEVTVAKDEAYFVDGSIPHSVWNDCSEQTVIVGISIK